LYSSFTDQLASRPYSTPPPTIQPNRVSVGVAARMPIELKTYFSSATAPPAFR
jgi:hypothetical protein